MKIFKLVYCSFHTLTYSRVLWLVFQLAKKSTYRQLKNPAYACYLHSRGNIIGFFSNFISKSRLQRNSERTPIRINLANIFLLIMPSQSNRKYVANGQFERLLHFGIKVNRQGILLSLKKYSVVIYFCWRKKFLFVYI